MIVLSEHNQQKEIRLKDCNLKKVSAPAQKIADPLTELLWNGSRDLIRQAVEAELGAMLSEYEDLKLIDGRHAIVRNGYLPESAINARSSKARHQPHTLRAVLIFRFPIPLRSCTKAKFPDAQRQVIFQSEVDVLLMLSLGSSSTGPHLQEYLEALNYAH